jgi:hypothetical protein
MSKHVQAGARDSNIPAVAIVGRSAAGARVVDVATLSAWGPAAIALIATGLVWAITLANRVTTRGGGTNHHSRVDRSRTP